MNTWDILTSSPGVSYIVQAYTPLTFGGLFWTRGVSSFILPNKTWGANKGFGCPVGIQSKFFGNEMANSLVMKYIEMPIAGGLFGANLYKITTVFLIGSVWLWSVSQKELTHFIIARAGQSRQGQGMERKERKLHDS